MLVGTLAMRRTHPLYRDLLADAAFHHLLLAFDRDLVGGTLLTATQSLGLGRLGGIFLLPR
jgi:hypothetical protein